MINVLRLINSIETTVASVSNKNSSHKQVIMAADEVSVSVVVSEVLDVKDGDYIYHNGLKYTQNRDAEYTKYSDVNYQYDLLFEHPSYRMLDKLFSYQLTGSAMFTLTGKLSDFVDLVCWNMNYHATNNPRGIDSGWIRGSVVDTDYLTLTFGSVSCRDAITQIATAFNAEFYFSADGKTINFVDHIENQTELVFVQGRGNGLYSVSQQNVDTKDTITRVYPVGGNKNVPNANADEDGNLKLPELYLQNTSEYSRVVEKRVVFDDVFPHFVGDVESVAGTNNVDIVCSDIDFDLNQIAVGDNARINFLTGSLMGKSFQFQFDFAAKKITLIPQNDETALTNDDGTTPQVPQPLKKAAIGDKFNFTGVVMPVQYVNTAIAKLREKGTSWLSFYSRKRVKYGLDIDYRWMRGKQQLNPGDLVTIQIPERGIDQTIRISDLTTNLYSGQLNATVSNYRDENWQKKVEGAISSLQTTVSGGGVGGGVDILERYDSRPSSNRNVMSSLRSEKNFLRKDVADTAAEHINFDKGLGALGFVQDKFAGAGAGIYEDEQGNSVIEVDKINVRKEAWFNEIVINQIRFQGGIVVYSAANLEVLSVVDGGSYLQVSFDTKDGQLANQFAVDDQIRCQRFSGGSVIKYYMSRVTSVGADYIRLSKSDIDGTLNVEVGDALVQFGNRTNTARQSLIEVNVLDGGKQTFYQGVNSYNLTNKNYLELGRVLVDGQWKNMIRSYGGAYIGNRDLSSYIQYNEVTGLVELKAQVQFMSAGGTFKDVQAGITEAQTAAQAAAALDAATKAATAKSEAIAASEQALNSNVATINSKFATLQSQVDGEVNNWFFPYVPSLTSYPANEWDTAAKKDAHVGDTFTNTQQFVDNNTTPHTGKSWRFVKDAGVWSWTQIADSDSVLALQRAATAQSTADGKCTTFLIQPTTYKKGDIWILAADWNGYKSGEMLNASSDSASFVSGHWGKKVKYTDDTAVNNMVIGGVNTFSYRNRATNMYWWNGLTVDLNNAECPYGFMAIGPQTGNGILRISNVIKQNGWHTVSFEMRGSQNVMIGINVDICDNGAKRLYTTADNAWQRVELSVNVTNYSAATYHFVDFEAFEWAHYYVRNIKIEQGSKATAFSKHPDDVAAEAAEVAAADASNKAGTAQTNAINAALEYGTGKNLFPLAEFQNGWGGFTFFDKPVYGSCNLDPTWSLGGNMNLSNNQGLNTTFLVHDSNNAILESEISTAVPAKYNCTGSAKYIASVYAATHRCDAQIVILWFDTNKSYISHNLQDTGFVSARTDVKSGGRELNGYKRLYIAATAPANACYYEFHIRKYGSYTGNDNSYAFFCRPAFEQVDARTTKPGPWSPFASSADIAAATAAAQLAQATAQGAATTANAITNNLTTVDGGLILTTLIKMLNAGTESAGMAAKTLENDIAFWGGGTLEQAIQRLTAFGVTHSGDAWFKGVIEAMSGKIGLFDILAGNIVGRDTDGIEKVRFGVENVPELGSFGSTYAACANGASLYVTRRYELNLYYDEYGEYWQTDEVQPAPPPLKTTIEFNLPYATNIRIKAKPLTWQSLISNISVTVAQTLAVRRKSDNALIGYATDMTNFAINSAGTYLLEVSLGMTVDLPQGSGGGSVDFYGGVDYIEYSESIQKTAIGKNGFYSYFSALEHIFFKSGVGFIGRGRFDIPAGLGGANVGSSGTHSNRWGLVDRTVRTTTTTTIYHNVTDTKITLNLTPRSSFTWYVSTITAATSPTANNGTIVVVCTQNTAVFDFVIVRTPY